MALIALTVTAGARTTRAQAPPPVAPAPAADPTTAILPAPAQMQVRTEPPFVVAPGLVIYVTDTGPARRIAGTLASHVARATGVLPTVTPGKAPDSVFAGATPIAGTIVLGLSSGSASEGYSLDVKPDLISLVAGSAAGLFYGVQTLRQLLPYWGEHEAVLFPQPRPAAIPSLFIVDAPRYGWRAAMLDVARHFFEPDDVKRYIDLIALHKMNRLHLHLADDQGWRIEIRKWPDLTRKGGRTEVGGTPGGFYTQHQYQDLVAYAAERFVTIVPEIDMPGHTNAALSSYAVLNCDGKATAPFTGTDVGFSSLCVDKAITYRFIEDVVREIAALSPAPYFHIGGDEVKTLKPEQYRMFVERVQAIVVKHGRRMLGWDEVAAAELHPTSIVQHWRPDADKAELARAPNLILSPADRLYLDMKYDADTAIGLRWAALIPVRAAYDWDPATLVPGAPASAILGIEAPLWSETTATLRDVEFLAFPRLAAVAELAWTPQERRDWNGFRLRLGAQGPRWAALGINFYRAPDVPWK